MRLLHGIQMELIGRRGLEKIKYKIFYMSKAYSVKQLEVPRRLHTMTDPDVWISSLGL
jgi:hypothetical protein